MPDHSHSLIAALRRPGVLLRTDQPVELLETHISWILLAGDYAWKLKKPVNLGFVDFTTLERRRFYCEEELRLNRRLAAELYLDVVAITGTPDTPAVNGSGPAIDYAVRMKRFPQDALLGRVLERGELAPRHIDAMARQLADFHRQIPPADPDSEYGRSAEVIHDALDALDHLRGTPAGTTLRQRLNRLEHWINARQPELQPHLDRRRAAGWVRECHGDLHLGNIILLDDQPVFFDCIEFNPGFRWIDVLNEVAFLIMDLERRGRTDYAQRMLNAYLERTGDYAGLPGLPFYVVYRAIVRAMVDGLRLTQPHEQRDDAAIQADLEAYLAVAERWTARPVPRLSITCGVSGSGKTTASQPLLERTGAIRIRSDVERKRLFGLAAEQTSGSAQDQGIYAPDASARTYERLLELAENILEAGFPVIIDATFLTRARRQQFRQLAARCGVPFEILFADADEATLRSRILHRRQQATDASEADLAVLSRQLQTREDFDPSESPYVVRLTLDVPTTPQGH